MGAARKKAWLAALLDRAVAAVDVIDFRGQLRAERAYQALILAAAAAGFAHGFATQSFAATFYWWLAASLLAGLLAVPGWPALYRRDPVRWLERLPSAEEEAAAEAAFEASLLPAAATMAAAASATRGSGGESKSGGGGGGGGGGKAGASGGKGGGAAGQGRRDTAATRA
jgi:uncharacterized membrane protein YgcG